MVERVAPAAGAVEVDPEVGAVVVLAEEVLEALGPERRIGGVALLGIADRRRRAGSDRSWRRTSRIRAGASASGCVRTAAVSGPSTSWSR